MARTIVGKTALCLCWLLGTNPPSFDKRFVRDWLEASHWNKKPPGPELPPNIVAQTAAKYREAMTRLVD